MSRTQFTMQKFYKNLHFNMLSTQTLTNPLGKRKRKVALQSDKNITLAIAPRRKSRKQLTKRASILKQRTTLDKNKITISHNRAVKPMLRNRLEYELNNPSCGSLRTKGVKSCSCTPEVIIKQNKSPATNFSSPISPTSPSNSVIKNEVEDFCSGHPNVPATGWGDLESYLGSLDHDLDENVRIGTSIFEPEIRNISAAIIGYKSGHMPYSSHLTIIYAGQIIDTIASYAELVKGRRERLNKYEVMYGPGWLWFEPPLDGKPDEQVLAMASTGLKRAETWNGMGPWDIHQGFWKRASFVRQQASQSVSSISSISSISSNSSAPSPPSQSSVPILDRSKSPDGKSVKSSLVDDKRPMIPDAPNYLGGLCPVLEIGGEVPVDERGYEVSARLSGMLPFLAFYVSVVPGSETVWFGESRNDVLGAERMPAHQRWDGTSVSKKGKSDDLLLEGVELDNPTVSFTHNNGDVMDQDSVHHDNVNIIEVHKVVRGRRTKVEKISDPLREAIERRKKLGDMIGAKEFEELLREREREAERTEEHLGGGREHDDVAFTTQWQYRIMDAPSV
ncbi:hypothetical protein B0J14DRAFT_639424 [Halenospora varia]|nr:hypothetical protein B0J14DRAFT_639424 [Halenospora varia]